MKIPMQFVTFLYMSLKVWRAASVHTTTELEIFEETNSDQ